MYGGYCGYNPYNEDGYNEDTYSVAESAILDTAGATFGTLGPGKSIYRTLVIHNCTILSNFSLLRENLWSMLEVTLV